jgi:hypothetical protein
MPKLKINPYFRGKCFGHYLVISVLAGKYVNEQSDKSSRYTEVGFMFSDLSNTFLRYERYFVHIVREVWYRIIKLSVSPKRIMSGNCNRNHTCRY